MQLVSEIYLYTKVTTVSTLPYQNIYKVIFIIKIMMNMGITIPHAASVLPQSANNNNNNFIYIAPLKTKFTKCFTEN